MSWQVVDRMTIYHETGMYALSPTVTRTPSGSLLVTFQRATHLGYSHHEHPLFNVQACRSEDEGQTWSGPHLVTVDPRGGVMDRGVHTLPDGSIFLHSSCTELVPAEDAVEHGGSWVVQHGKPFWVRSRDDGHTWSAPVRFPPLPDAVWGHPCPAFRGQSKRSVSDAGWTIIDAEQSNRSYHRRVSILRYDAGVEGYG